MQVDNLEATIMSDERTGNKAEREREGEWERERERGSTSGAEEEKENHAKFHLTGI